MKQPILITGSHGLVGSKFESMFLDKYQFERMDISDPDNAVDITNIADVMSVFKKSPADFVVHFAAYTDVTGAWKQRGDNSGIAYKVNVEGTENIVRACKNYNKHLIHISTAYVFDGKKEGLYSEKDQPNPIEWYGQTKAEAEKIITDSEIDWTILRIDQPFRSDPGVRPDIVRRIANGLKNKTLYPQFNNHFFGPTFIDDLALVIDWVIRTKTTGLFNASSGEKWTDFEFAQEINKMFKFNQEVKQADLHEYLKTLERPYQVNTAMDNSKLKNALDFELQTIKQALSKVTI